MCVCVNRKKQGVNDLTGLIREQLDGDVLLYTFHAVRHWPWRKGRNDWKHGGGGKGTIPQINGYKTKTNKNSRTEVGKGGGRGTEIESEKEREM